LNILGLIWIRIRISKKESHKTSQSRRTRNLRQNTPGSAPADYRTYKRGSTHEQAHEVTVVKETDIPDFKKLMSKLDTNIIVKNIGKGSYLTGSHLNSE
jgi:hypothetical protein